MPINNKPTRQQMPKQQGNDHLQPAVFNIPPRSTKQATAPTKTASSTLSTTNSQPKSVQPAESQAPVVQTEKYVPNRKEAPKKVSDSGQFSTISSEQMSQMMAKVGIHKSSKTATSKTLNPETKDAETQTDVNQEEQTQVETESKVETVSTAPRAELK